MPVLLHANSPVLPAIARTASTGSTPSTARKRSQYRVQNRIETLANILGKETQNKIPVLLKQHVLASVASIRFGVR
jgi:hypothetical protein